MYETASLSRPDLVSHREIGRKIVPDKTRMRRRQGLTDGQREKRAGLLPTGEGKEGHRFRGQQLMSDAGFLHSHSGGRICSTASVFGRPPATASVVRWRDGGTFGQIPDVPWRKKGTWPNRQTLRSAWQRRLGLIPATNGAEAAERCSEGDRDDHHRSVRQRGS